MRSIRMSRELHAYIINSTRNKAPGGIKLEVDFLIEKLGGENKKCVYGGSGRVHTLSAPGMQRRENEILDRKVEFKNKKIKIKNSYERFRIIMASAL